MTLQLGISTGSGGLGNPDILDEAKILVSGSDELLIASTKAVNVFSIPHTIFGSGFAPSIHATDTDSIELLADRVYEAMKPALSAQSDHIAYFRTGGGVRLYTADDFIKYVRFEARLADLAGLDKFDLMLGGFIGEMDDEQMSNWVRYYAPHIASLAKDGHIYNVGLTFGGWNLEKVIATAKQQLAIIDTVDVVLNGLDSTLGGVVAASQINFAISQLGTYTNAKYITVSENTWSAYYAQEEPDEEWKF